MSPARCSDLYVHPLPEVLHDLGLSLRGLGQGRQQAPGPADPFGPQAHGILLLPSTLAWWCGPGVTLGLTPALQPRQSSLKSYLGQACLQADTHSVAACPCQACLQTSPVKKSPSRSKASLSVGTAASGSVRCMEKVCNIGMLMLV